ncbi:MAG: FtsX-like permease family protein [Spiroplasma sp.]
MTKKEKDNKKNILFNQKQDSKVIKKRKFQFFEHSLLLKQTLITAWKNKLQLVILLLLTSFTTSLITGSWISYQRINEGKQYLQLDDAKFDAVLPYNWANNISQIANQAFSLKLGRLHYQSSESSTSVALYYDNTIIGQEIKPINSSDLKITYTRESGAIDGVSDFQWTNPNKPLEFNLNNNNVKASIYGQLILKADQTSNIILKTKYLDAATDLYTNLFVRVSAGQILDSLKSYFTDWIKVNSSDPKLKLTDNQEFTTWLLANKVNYRGDGERDLRIPDDVNVADDIKNSAGVLATKLVKANDLNPRLSPSGSLDFGMNGQWMRIYRNFDINSDVSIISDFANYYNSPSRYNQIWDGSDPNIYSYGLANAVATLQNRNVSIVNQFAGTAKLEESTGKSINVKVVNLGLEKNHNNVNLKIFEGIYPSSKNEIAISPQYARTHKIKPGNIININNKPFIVSAIAGDAYNIYPTINLLDSIPNTRTEFIAYVLPDGFNNQNWFRTKDVTDLTLMYFIPWKNVSIPNFNISYFNDYFQKIIFGDNKIADRYQYDYNQYLIEKYLNNNPEYQSKYQLSQNLVITKDDAQFDIYARGWNLLNLVTVSFKYTALIGVVFLVSIIIFITYLIVKKAIEKGKVSMGILKSSGYSTGKIIVSYLAYPLMVLLIAIPIGWFVGLVVQVYFSEILNSIFILPYNILNFDLIPLFISIILICGFVLIATLITGYKILQKAPLDLIKQDSEITMIGESNKIGFLQKILKKSFKSRFLLSLSKNSWKKIAVTSLVIAVSTLSITATISIPATITSMRNNYFKTQKYKNYYQYQNPIPNMPLSKYGFSAWNNLNNIKKEPYYPTSATMPWPENIIINNKTTGKKLAWYDPLQYEKNENTNNFKNIIKFDDSVDEATRQNIIDQVGKQLLSLDNGALDMNFLTWSYSWLGARAFSNAFLKDLSKLDKSTNQNFSNSMIIFAVTLLPGLIGAENPGIPPGPEAITEILKQTLPGFIRQILANKGINAYDYFSLGHNIVSYNPNYNSEVDGPEEELVTQFQLGSTDKKLSKSGFLDIQGINPKTKMLFMKPHLIEDMKYKSSATVVPMVVNRSFVARFNLSTGDEFNAAPNVKTLYYLNKKNKLVPLPKNSWYYGDNPVEGDQLIWNKSANRWNYRGQKAIDNTDYSNSFGYKYNGIYDKDGNRVLSEEPSEWNDMNKIWLKLPDDINESAKKGSIRTSNTSGNLSFDIKNISNGDGEWIKPFSYDVTDKYKGVIIEPTNLLMNKIPEWYGGMLDKKILVVKNNLHLDNLKEDIEDNIAIWWERNVGTKSPITKYRIIGIQDSYDTPKAYIDQKWANFINGYSYYNNRSDETKDPIYAPGIYQWFSGKLSASDDIYDIVGRMSFKRDADDYTMYAMDGLNGNKEVQLVVNSDLLLRKKEMLKKMSDITLSASLLFIVTTIICSILIVIMITDVFTNQFRRFMSHMKAEGYTNYEINSFTLGIFTPWVFVGYVVGYGLGFLTVFAFIRIISIVAGLAFPFSFIWWIIPLSFIMIALVYFSTFVINTYQLNRMNLIEQLKSDE